MQGRARKRKTTNKESEEVVDRESLPVMKYPRNFNLIMLTFLTVNNRLIKYQTLLTVSFLGFFMIFSPKEMDHTCLYILAQFCIGEKNTKFHLPLPFLLIKRSNVCSVDCNP